MTSACSGGMRSSRAASRSASSRSAGSGVLLGLVGSQRFVERAAAFQIAAGIGHAAVEIGSGMDDLARGGQQLQKGLLHDVFGIASGTRSSGQQAVELRVVGGNRLGNPVGLGRVCSFHHGFKRVFFGCASDNRTPDRGKKDVNRHKKRTACAVRQGITRRFPSGGCLLRQAENSP